MESSSYCFRFLFNVMMSLSPMYWLRISGSNGLSDLIMKSRVYINYCSLVALMFTKVCAIHVTILVAHVFLRFIPLLNWRGVTVGKSDNDVTHTNGTGPVNFQNDKCVIHKDNKIVFEAQRVKNLCSDVCESMCNYRYHTRCSCSPPIYSAAKLEGRDTDEVKQINYLLLQLGTSRPSGPSSSQQQEEQVHVQEMQVPEQEEPVLEQQSVEEKEPKS
ncbi:hypothetical protein Taro_001892 [Colocasia esculenta]|uniref:Uncharacterized protein n=1 Tax=Colocasia esculenta TaxID=4460 RepID=A0A843TH96_COLES|nr:hypothetical protein [Colocasia esculenta]